MTDIELIIEFNNGSHHSMTIIYERLYSGVYYFAKKFVSDEDAADLTADVFVNLFKSKETFQAVENIKAWLIVSVRNACLKKLEKDKNKILADKEFIYRLSTEQPIWLDEQEQLEIQSAYFKIINGLINELSEQKQTIFKLAYHQGMKNAEIAARLNVDERKVRNTKMRILTFLRAVLNEKGMAIILGLSFWIVGLLKGK